MQLFSADATIFIFAPENMKKLPSNRVDIHNQLCIALLETPPCSTSI